MTTRLAIIGNSHTGALKRAWDETDARPAGLEISFFALPDDHLRHFRLDDQLVFALPRSKARRRPILAERACEINGASEIDLSGMDAVLLYGGLLPHWSIAKLIATYDVDGYRAAGSPRRMSRAAFEAICDDLAQAALPRTFWLDRPIPRLAAFLRPLPAEGAVSSAKPANAAWRRVAARPEEGARAMIERLFLALEAAHARHGIDFLRQPAATITASGMTNGVYSRGSIRLVRDEKHPSSDVSHMNARYGALCLQPILAWAQNDARDAA